MRNKKSTPALRQPQSIASPSSPSDAFFPPTPTSIAFSTSNNAPYSASDFDQYMMRSEGGKGKGVNNSGGNPSKGGLGKKLLSFPWTKSEKKNLAQQIPPPSPTTISSPIPAILQTTTSLPLGFPTPPPPSAYSSNMPRQHPSVAMMTSQSNQSNHQDSNSSLSTFRTTSSFASTALFNSSNDGWDSEATSHTSSPESGRDSCGEAVPHRMWKVKQEQLDPVREEEETRSLRYSVDGRRNSTPVPRMVAAMLADPETPPRPKRFSTSSKPSPSSPPFDPAYEQAAARQRKESERHQEGQASNVSSPGSPGDADDEVSPPKQRGRYMRRDRSEDDLLTSTALSSKTRIPSIRFEGLSMDAVFAEVEKKINSQGKGLSSEGSSSSQLDKRSKRRSHVLSLYKPLDFNFDEESTLPPSPSPSSSTTTMESLRSGSVTPTNATSFDLSRPRPIPRRTSSRPTPLNVFAANAVSNGPASAPVFGTSTPVSPTTPTRISPEPSPSVSDGASTPTQLSSPPLSGSFSPRTASNGFAPSSPSLGEPFMQSPGPSPALSSTSTFRPYDIPEVCVFPPSPEQRDRQVAVATRVLPGRRSSEPAPPSVMVSGGTKVTVVHDKKVVRVSTRAPSKRSDRQRVFTPPSAPVVSVTQASPHRPSPLELRQSPTLSTPPLSPSLDSPTIPTFSSVPYNVPTVARTDFHPALSSLRVEHANEEDSSDCEETLNHLLMRLQRPHTPPTLSDDADSTSLTENALQIHTASQKRVSMIARGMDSNDINPSPSPSPSPSPTNRSLSSLSQGKENVSPLSVRRMHRKSRVYESDDSATRYGDAPLTISVPEPFSRSNSQPSLLEASSEEEEGESSDDYAATKRAQNDLEREIEDTLASIAASSSTSTFSSISSPPPHPPKMNTGSSNHRRTQDDSISSTSSSFSFTDESPTSSSCSGGGGLPHSESYSSNLTIDSFDSTATETEEAIVCLGERIECNYNVGVIGMAM